SRDGILILTTDDRGRRTDHDSNIPHPSSVLRKKAPARRGWRARDPVLPRGSESPDRRPTGGGSADRSGRAGTSVVLGDPLALRLGHDRGCGDDPSRSAAAAAARPALAGARDQNASGITPERLRQGGANVAPIEPDVGEHPVVEVGEAGHVATVA